MFTEITIEGFKRFGDPISIPLGPITLLLGGNSAGKSTVIQALMLLKQSFAASPVGFMSLKTEGEYVQLGRFGNIQNNHNPEKAVSFELKWENSLVSLSYSDPNEYKGNDTKGYGVLNELKSFTLKFGDNALIMEPWSLEDRGSRKSLKISNSTWIESFTGKSSDFSEFCTRAAECKSPVICVEWSIYGRSYDVEVDYDAYINDEDKNESENKDNSKKKVSDSLKNEIDSIVRRIIDKTLYRVDETLQMIRRIGPIRVPGKRLYPVDIYDISDVGSDGRNMAQVLLVGDRASIVNEYMETIGLPYKIQLQELNTLSRTIDIRLEDKRIDNDENSSPLVGISDVGFGISQIMPILVQLSEIKERIHLSTNQLSPITDPEIGRGQISNGRVGLMIVEQPELHLHPSWQVRLMKLFSDPSLKECQFLIETHSEVVVRSLTNLINENHIQAQDLCIASFDVDKLSGMTEVKRIRLRQNGDFLTAWPNGFFDERRSLELKRKKVSDL